jgi:hypothetical protein
MEVEEQDTPRDFLGQEILIGDYVIAGQGHELALYEVIRITPKMVRVVKYNAKTSNAKKGKLRYSKELFKVDTHLVTFYIMSH